MTLIENIICKAICVYSTLIVEDESLLLHGVHRTQLRGTAMRVAYPCLIASSILISASANAQIGGGAFIPLESSSNHACIDVSKYKVSIMVVTLQAKRTDTFWKKSKTLGAKFDVVITNQDGKAATFPRGVQLTAKDISGDIALLPAQFPIMSKYTLNDSRPFNNISLNFYIINLEKESDAVKGILHFIEFTKSLPLPPNPYLQGVQLFGDFAQQVVNNNIQSAEEKQPVATVSFDLPSTDEDVKNCPPTGLREGPNAIMFEYPESGAGILRVDETSNYCFYYDQPSSRIVYRKKSANLCNLNDPPTILKNPLVAFIVSKWSKSPTATSLDIVLGNVRTDAQALPSAKWMKITDSDTKLALGRRVASTRMTDLKTESENVKTVFRGLNNPGDWTTVQTKFFTPDASTSTAARVIEAETAINLYYCALVGINAAACP